MKEKQNEKVLRVVLKEMWDFRMLKHLLVSMFFLLAVEATVRAFFYISSLAGIDFGSAIQRILYILPFILFVSYILIYFIVKTFISLKFIFHTYRAPHAYEKSNVPFVDREEMISSSVTVSTIKR